MELLKKVMLHEDKKAILKKGDSAVVCIRTKVIIGAVEIVVFCPGAIDLQNTVLPEDNLSFNVVINSL